MNPRWKQRPPGSNWGEFGPDDQLGRLNLLTPEQSGRQGALKLGMEHMAEKGVQGRAVMIDLHHQRYRFLLTAPPLRLPGAVGSPVNPIATV